MKRYLGVCLVCISSLALYGSENQKRGSDGKKVRKAISDSVVIAAVQEVEAKKKLATSAPMNISNNNRRKSPEVVHLGIQAKSPTQAVTPGDYFNQCSLGERDCGFLVESDYNQGCSPSPSDYFDSLR